MTILPLNLPLLDGFYKSAGLLPGRFSGSPDFARVHDTIPRQHFAKIINTSLNGSALRCQLCRSLGERVRYVRFIKNCVIEVVGRLFVFVVSLKRTFKEKFVYILLFYYSRHSDATVTGCLLHAYRVPEYDFDGPICGSIYLPVNSEPRGDACADCRSGPYECSSELQPVTPLKGARINARSCYQYCSDHPKSEACRGRQPGIPLTILHAGALPSATVAAPARGLQ